ncbi:creatininase family protein [Pseudalkalibacillus decolorationis]|uniref:creatininase family protein n=1 Tax=Pseudalkalibacillus decolorationis TaxID=163879 RepID=UPI0021486E3B|nr:creatininase family protein [Pseudalkalibacillus decolorationis]
MKPYLLTEMTHSEVRDALETVKLAIIPIGAHEQHGPHMVESCDAVLATEMAKKLGERLHPYALISPTINMGVSHHHLNFPGTISLEPSTLIAILRDMVKSLKKHEITNFLLLNAHGGNQATLNVASITLSSDLGVKVYYAKTTASAKKAMEKHIQSPIFGHSCEREVSEALYLAPHLVRTDLLVKADWKQGDWKKLRPGNAVQGPYQYEEMTANGCIGDATRSSVKIGREIVDEALDELEQALTELLKLKSPTMSSP